MLAKFIIITFTAEVLLSQNTALACSMPPLGETQQVISLLWS